MNTQENIQNASVAELQALIASAQIALKEKQKSKRKEVEAQIEELARSIGVKAVLSPIEGKKKSSVEAKYRNPDNAAQTWTGRGLAPKWMQKLVSEGHSKEEFKIAA